MGLLVVLGCVVALQSPVAQTAAKPRFEEVTLFIQGMSCDACAVKVKETLDKKSAIQELTLQFNPSVAHFKINAERETIQDLIKQVQEAGSQYDARLMLQSDFDDDKLSEALRKVDGVRSAGMKNSKNIRLVTFFMDKKTYFSDLQKAAAEIGAKLVSPTFKKEKPGS